MFARKYSMLAIVVPFLWVSCSDDNSSSNNHPQSSTVSVTDVVSDTARIIDDVTNGWRQGFIEDSGLGIKNQLFQTLRTVGFTDEQIAFLEDLVNDVTGKPDIEVTRDVGGGSPWSDLIQRVIASLLLQGNIENVSLQGITYRLPGETVCIIAVDYDACRESAHSLQWRLRVSMATPNGYNMRFMVGPDRVKLFDIQIRSTPRQIAVETYLSALSYTFDYAGPSVGGNIQKWGENIDSASGRIRTIWTVAESPSLKFVFGVMDQATMAFHDSNGPNTIMVAKADPAFVATRDEANDDQVQMTLALGSVDYQLPFVSYLEHHAEHHPEDSGDCLPATGPHAQSAVMVHLDGADFVYTANAMNRLPAKLEGIGLGHRTSTVNVDEIQVASLDLNADQDRTFNLDLGANDAMTEMWFRVKPLLNIKMGAHFAEVADELCKPLNPGLADENYTLNLSNGDQARVTPIPPNPISGFKGGVRVDEGMLTLSAESAPDATVTVPTGRCLVRLDQLPEGAHPVLGYYQVDDDCQ